MLAAIPVRGGGPFFFGIAADLRVRAVRRFCVVDADADDKRRLFPHPAQLFSPLRVTKKKKNNTYTCFLQEKPVSYKYKYLYLYFMTRMHKNTFSR